jgi:hypothetical protein
VNIKNRKALRLSYESIGAGETPLRCVPIMEYLTLYKIEPV